MRRIFTFSFLAAALVVASFNSFAQCGNIQYDFTAGGTNGFAGSGSGSFSASGGALAFSNVNNGTLSLTTPTFHLPNSATSIDFGFTWSHGAQADISSATVAVRYVNTSGQIVTTAPQAFTITSPVCTTVPIPADIRTTGASGNNYQLIFSFTVTGNGGGAANISIDNYRTSSTAALAALPVKFQALDARTINNSVSLKWVVGTEENVDGYEIEKSADGRNYAKIGFVSANGSSNYSFVDSKTSPVAYYRIKSVDIGGKYGYSTIVLVKAGQSIIVLKAFPTPFVSSLSIQHATATANSLITINSEDGRLLKSIVPSIGTQQTDVDLSVAKPGLYLVRFASGNGTTETLKVVKQ